MIRENRYLVIKRKDILAHLTAAEEYKLAKLIEKVDEGRKQNGKAELSCVVVEADWPEYELVWQMIEKRVDEQQAS